MPPAARISDMHVCPLVTPGTPPVPHVGGPVLVGAPTVITAFMPQARVGDTCTCVGPPDAIAAGSPTVLVCGMPAARMGDATVHGGSVVSGAPNVLIGVSGAGSASVENSSVRRFQLQLVADGEGDPVEVPEEPHPFEEEFQQKTGGLTMDRAITLYELETGETVEDRDAFKDMIQTLFTDDKEARRILTSNPSLDREFRDILNTNVPGQMPTETIEVDGQTFYVDENGERWIRLAPGKSVFHNPLYDWTRNSKFVSEDGHREPVYDRNGILVRGEDSVYRGTFNFFGPDQESEHTNADVLPWAWNEGTSYLKESGADLGRDTVSAGRSVMESIGSGMRYIGDAVRSGWNSLWK